MPDHVFRDAKRQLSGVLARAESKVLLWMARHTPAWVNSDHLTLLGFFAMIGAGLCYSLSGKESLYLHAVNACLVLNWVGDSLDGTLARFRNRLRPRYGFYVDHIIDTLGTLFLVGGLAFSGYMSERVALFLLIAYYMLSINVYLTAYSLGTFKISFGAFSPTELRILLIVGNLFLFYTPKVQVLGQFYLLFDVGGTIGILGMILILVVTTVTNTVKLYRIERI
jgi:archaetidylinositol phosphate synthase